MNKIMKLISVILIMILIIFVSISINAYTNQDVIDYLTEAHTVNGKTLQLTKDVQAILDEYLSKPENQVTDEQANAIIAKLEEAKAKLEATNVNQMAEVPIAVKAEVINLIKEAANIAGLNLEVDVVNDYVTVKDKAGQTLCSSKSYNWYFGIEEPDDPNKPVDPDDPNKPVNPDDPSKPVNPDDPTKPGDSTDNNNNNSSNNNGNTGSSTNGGTSNGLLSNLASGSSSSSSKLVYTGNDYTGMIKSVIAIVAVAIVFGIGKKACKMRR